MPIKTRESLRTIKVFDRAKSLTEKAKSGANEVKEYAEDMQNVNYESQNEYAGNQVQTTEGRVARNAVYGASRLGNWGIRETRKNILKWRNHPSKLNVQQPKQLSAPKRKALSAPKKAAKTAKKTAKSVKATAKTTAKAAKATVKATKRAAQVAKRAAQITIKAVKVAVKAIIAAVKATVAAIKGIVAAIAAGGWIAVVVILIICIVALVVGSIFGVFLSDDSTSEGGVTITQTLRSAERDFYDQIEALKSEYTYDMCYTNGEPCDLAIIIAVYAVKTNQTDEVATFNEEKAQILREVYMNLNTVTARTEMVTIKEKHLEVLDDGKTIEIEIEVEKTYLYIDISPYSQDDAITLYGFIQEDIDKLNLLLSDDNADMWEELIG